jgi:hypothetical protein
MIRRREGLTTSTGHVHWSVLPQNVTGSLTASFTMRPATARRYGITREPVRRRRAGTNGSITRSRRCNSGTCTAANCSRRAPRLGHWSRGRTHPAGCRWRAACAARPCIRRTSSARPFLHSGRRASSVHHRSLTLGRVEAPPYPRHEGGLRASVRESPNVQGMALEHRSPTRYGEREAHSEPTGDPRGRHT